MVVLLLMNPCLIWNFTGLFYGKKNAVISFFIPQNFIENASLKIT